MSSRVRVRRVPQGPVRWYWLAIAVLCFLAAVGDVVYASISATRKADSSGHGQGTATSTTVQVLGDQRSRTPAAKSGPGDQKAFTISGHVGGLYPGTDVPLTLTFTNPNSSAIRITSVTITVTAADAACASSLLSFGSLPPVVVPNSGTTTGQIATRLSAAAGDRCQGVTWHLSYSGQAVKA